MSKIDVRRIKTDNVMCYLLRDGIRMCILNCPPDQCVPLAAQANMVLELIEED